LPDAEPVRAVDHPRIAYRLGPPIQPLNEVRTGRLYRAQRVWAIIDLLLTCDTISTREILRTNGWPLPEPKPPPPRSGDEYEQFLVRCAEAEQRIAEGADPYEEVSQVAQAMSEVLAPSGSEQVERNLAEKETVARFTKLTDLLNEILQDEKPVVSGETIEERAAQFTQLGEHARGLWRDAVVMFESGRFGTATFLAIACMEEVGKGGIARFQVAVGALRSSDPEATAHGKKRRKNPLYSHPQKHLLVAAQGALINSRLDHLLGFERIKQFIDDAEAGDVERLRQAALYTDHNGAELLLPEDLVTEEAAVFHVILAGELMAEVLGLEPEQWSALLDEVKQFEQAQGYVRE